MNLVYLIFVRLCFVLFRQYKPSPLYGGHPGKKYQQDVFGFGKRTDGALIPNSVSMVCMVPFLQNGPLARIESCKPDDAFHPCFNLFGFFFLFGLPVSDHEWLDGVLLPVTQIASCAAANFLNLSELHHGHRPQ